MHLSTSFITCVFSIVYLKLLLSSHYSKLTSDAVLCPASDYYQFDDLLNPEEKALRRKVREVMEKEIAPIMSKVHFMHLVFVSSCTLIRDEA